MCNDDVNDDVSRCTAVRGAREARESILAGALDSA